MQTLYKRVIIKFSGEALAENDGTAILSKSKLLEISSIISSLTKEGVQVGIVTGAGNIWRGRLASSIGLDPERADYMGMTATILNALAIENCLKNAGIDAACLSALPYENVCETYSASKANEYLSQGKVLVFAAGTGKPFCTTDSCASIRALEINADAILMGKNNVDGVYDSNPTINKDAKFIKHLSFKEIVDKKLEVIDSGSAKMLIGSPIVVRIFNMAQLSNFTKVVHGEDVGTILDDKE